MSLTEFKEVAKIDTRIQKIHKELSELYERRQRLAQANRFVAVRGTNGIARMSATEKEYARLVNVWHRYGIKPPTFKYLKPQLQNAQVVIHDLAAAQPELKGNLSLVLVPPTRELKNAVEGRSAVQRFVTAADSADSELPTPAASQKWRLLVAYTAKEGLAWATARTILADELYMIGGHDARALGMEEYAALTLHQTTPIDEDNWTMLLRDLPEDDALTCATFENGCYRFDSDDLDNIFGDDRFRPAVEV